MKKIISIAFIFMLFTCSAFAVDWDDSSKAEVQSEFSHIFDAFRDKDVDGAIKAIPPGFLGYFAKQHNVSETQLEPSMRQLMQAGFEALKSMTLDYDASKTEYYKADNGDLYALIPFKSQAVTIDDEKMDTDSLTFAFKVKDAWYFVNLENPINKEAIKSVYPQFKDAQFTLKGQ